MCAYTGMSAFVGTIEFYTIRERIFEEYEDILCQSCFKVLFEGQDLILQLGYHFTFRYEGKVRLVWNICFKEI